MRDFSDDIADLRKRLDEAFGYLRIEDLRRQRPQIETEATRPDLWDDADNARKVTGELSSLIADIELYESLEGGIEDAETLAELAREEPLRDDATRAHHEQAEDGLLTGSPGGALRKPLEKREREAHTGRATQKSAAIDERMLGTERAEHHGVPS